MGIPQNSAPIRRFRNKADRDFLTGTTRSAANHNSFASTSDLESTRKPGVVTYLEALTNDTHNAPAANRTAVKKYSQASATFESELNCSAAITKQIADGLKVTKTFGKIYSSHVLVGSIRKIRDLRVRRPGRSSSCGQGFYLPKRDRCASNVLVSPRQIEARNGAASGPLNTLPK